MDTQNQKNERGTLSKPRFYIFQQYLKFLGGTLKNGKLWRTHQVVTISITVPGTVEQKVFLCHENKSHQGVQGVLMWHDLTCCLILFGLVHNIQIWTFNFHYGTILGKHSNHFRTPRTSRSWMRYPSPSNNCQQMNHGAEKKTFISHKRLHPALPRTPVTKGNSSSNPTVDGRNPAPPKMYKPLNIMG